MKQILILLSACYASADESFCIHTNNMSSNVEANGDLCALQITNGVVTCNCESCSSGCPDSAYTPVNYQTVRFNSRDLCKCGPAFVPGWKPEEERRVPCQYVDWLMVGSFTEWDVDNVDNFPLTAEECRDYEFGPREAKKILFGLTFEQILLGLLVVLIILISLFGVITFCSNKKSEAKAPPQVDKSQS